MEVDAAVGSLVYRDDRVLAFTFPGLRDDGTEQDPKGSVNCSIAMELLIEITAEVDALARNRRFETPPRCKLSDSTRSFISMAKETACARGAVEIPIHRPWQIPEAQCREAGHVCPVCQVRRSDSAQDKQRPCKVCHCRRQGRLDEWEENGGDTIWIDEVADDNDRVALITISLDLSRWVDGSWVDSLRTQSIAEWADNNRELKDNESSIQNPVDLRQPFYSLHDAVESYVKKPVKQNSRLSNPVISSLSNGFQHEESLGEFFRKIVEDRANAPRWDDLDDPQRADWLTHQLFRKNASPGRIHRFWRTTEQFFAEILGSFREEASRHANRWRVRRLVLLPKEPNGWAGREVTYTSKWRDAPLELLFREDSQDFITICNVARLLSPAEDAAVLDSKSIELTANNRQPIELEIERASEAAGTLGVYSPLIVLEQSPERFRVLVPLSAANACIEKTIAKWEAEFARAWDRLPLRIGVVAFPRKTTYQAVVEAARNLEDDLTAGEDEIWRVRSANTRDGVTALSLIRKDGKPELVTLPTRLPDGREDLYYPYCQVEDGSCRDVHDFHAPAKNGPGAIYRRMPALRVGDGIRVAPSRVATVFLETTARRFDPPAARALADWKRLIDIWRLVEERAPSLTAVRSTFAAIADAKVRWSETDGSLGEAASRIWLDFARSLLATEWNVSGAALDELVDAVRIGVLQDTLDWHLGVLKLEWRARDEQQSSR